MTMATTGCPSNVILTEMPEVIVLGGGLAGLVAAKALAEAHVRVEVWESSCRFGGKAGSVPVPCGDRLADHGYHIFPAWYRNTRALLASLKVELVDHRDFFEVQPRVVRRPNDPPFHKIEPPIFSRTMLATMELVSRPDWYLDEFSLDGFLRSRLYAGRSSGDRLREIARKGLASPPYRSSALTLKRNMDWWLRVFKQPNWSLLPGPLQEEFINPLVQATVAAGAVLVPQRTVTGADLDAGRIVAIKYRQGSNCVPDPQVVYEVPEGTDVISALPIEVLQHLLRTNANLLSTLSASDDPLLRTLELTAAPMSAVDLHLRKGRIPGLPPGHFLLRHSRYELSGIEITDIWRQYQTRDHPTVVQLIAGDPTTIGHLPQHQFVEAVIRDLARFVDINLGDVDWDRTIGMPHLDEPLFMNDVGSDTQRTRTCVRDVHNLFMAGDHTKTRVDLATMEGAIESGLRAAVEVCGGRRAAAPTVLEPQGLPRWLVRSWKVLRYPLAVLASPLRLTDVHYWGRAFREYVLLKQEDDERHDAMKV
jgi:hypothetical protein